jgi:hypothetical protein
MAGETPGLQPRRQAAVRQKGASQAAEKRFQAVILSEAKNLCSSCQAGERKKQLQRSFARPKAGRAQDDSRFQLFPVLS